MNHTAIQHDAQDMDIDILQVQETVTVDTNGTIVYNDKGESNNTTAASTDTIATTDRADDAGSSSVQLQVNRCKVYTF